MNRTLSNWAFIIPFLAFAAFATTDLAVHSLGNQLVAGIEPDEVRFPSYAEVRARYRWLAVTAVFTFLATVACLCFFTDLFGKEPGPDGLRAYRYARRVRIAGSLIFMMVAGPAFVIAWQNSGAQTYSLLGQDLFETSVSLCLAPDHISTPDGACFWDAAQRTGYEFIMDWGSGFAVVGVTACAVGSMLSLARRKEANFTESALTHANFYLYLSSGLLSVGLLAMMMWMRFPLATLSDPDKIEAYKGAMDALILFFAVSYSIVIFSFNMPTIAWLRLQLYQDLAVTKPPGKSGPSHWSDGVRAAIAASLTFFSPLLLPLANEVGHGLYSILTGQ